MKKKGFGGISKLLLLIYMIFMFFVLINTKILNPNIDPLVIITFLIIGIISIFQIIRDKTPYSLNKTFWYFNLIFFTISPLIQYINNYHMWNYPLSNNTYLITNLFIIFTNIIYIFLHKRIDCDKIQNKGDLSFNINPFVKIISILISTMCLFIAIKDVGFLNLFSRSENVYTLFSDNTINTVAVHLLKCIPVYFFIMMYYDKKKNKILSLYLLIIISILNFPTSTTRFWMGTIYIGLFLLLFNKKYKDNRLYDVLILVTFTFLFSLLFMFKNNDISYYLKNGIKLNSFTESYNSVDYDSYSMIPRTFDYVKNNDVVYGKQLFGTLFFLVPRKVWSNKPNPSGELIVSSQGQHYTNVSCPFLSEGYLNFGLFGVIIFQILLILIINKLDYNYWINNTNQKLNLIYPFLLGFLIFLQRGALHPVVIYLFCFMVPLLAYASISNIFKIRGKK